MIVQRIFSFVKSVLTDKDIKIFGIDVSTDLLDVYNDSLVIMEATGYYHYRLAQYLDSKGIQVSVVNPLSIKRFLQMKLAKIKTDKSDAKAICEYACLNSVPNYTSLDKVQAECLQLFRLLDSYTKKQTATKNKLHGEKVLGIPSKIVYKSLERDLKHLKREIKLLENRLLELVK